MIPTHEGFGIVPADKEIKRKAEENRIIETERKKAEELAAQKINEMNQKNREYELEGEEEIKKYDKHGKELLGMLERGEEFNEAQKEVFENFLAFANEPTPEILLDLKSDPDSVEYKIAYKLQAAKDRWSQVLRNKKSGLEKRVRDLKVLEQMKKEHAVEYALKEMEQEILDRKDLSPQDKEMEVRRMRNNFFQRSAEAEMRAEESKLPYYQIPEE